MKKVKKIWKYYQHHGLKLLIMKIFNRYHEKTVDYMKWLEKNGANETTLENQSQKIFETKVTISIAVPTYHTPEKFLREMIESVQKQSYVDWELCIADGSKELDVYHIIQEYAKKDSRIKVKKLTKNKGIAENTNEALNMCTGEYVGLLDHDDILAFDALYEIRCAIDENNNPEIIYTDEDKMSMDGTIYFDPHFKSDFNKELLRSNNYICHLFVVSRSVLQRVGGLCEEYDGAQDYDFILRCTECADSIVHVAKPLYHWRSHTASTAENPESKLYAYESGKKAILAHLSRQGEKGVVKHADSFGFYHVRYKLKAQDRITIIIVKSSKRHVNTQVKKCIKSIKKTIGYTNYHVLVVDRLSDLRIADIEGKYILLVNSTISMISHGWIKEMLGNCQRDYIGAVGIKLYNKNETIRHGGIISGLQNYAFEGLPRVSYGYFHRDSIMQYLSAVTTDFMMVPLDVFLEIYKNYPKCMVNERSFCRKIREMGKEIVYNPCVEAYIFGESSRGVIDFYRDRYYNDNLSLKASGYSIEIDE